MYCNGKVIYILHIASLAENITLKLIPSKGSNSEVFDQEHDALATNSIRCELLKNVQRWRNCKHGEIS